MLAPSTYKALLITALLFSILALGLTSIHLQNEKEESLFSVEYYFEEEEEEEEEKSDQSEDLETHRAYNEAEKELIKAEELIKESQDEFTRHMQAMDEALKSSNKQPVLPETALNETYS